MSPAAAEQEIFARVLACPDPAERAVLLGEACSGNAPLRARVEALLAAAEQAGDFLEPAADRPGAADGASIGEGPGSRIGAYHLLEKIGEGGSGVVYMAEQEEPMRRTVALKILKPGMDTRAVVARFEAERQALALMDHPHIARIFDGGATAEGRPYFVMELVRGVPVTEYCDAAALGTNERLRLFRQICEAVHHAHCRGIIHRDLKPANILVTVNDGVAVPRIIDFGIAKSTGLRLTDKSLFTRFHAFIGTPAYTSPEQAEMSSVEVDSRSDVYSLGVLLYELLTGRTPFDSGQLWSAGLDEMRRIIRDDQPARPSRLVRTLSGEAATELSRKRSAAVPALVTSLEGDLDWIVMKCLEKDRGRRYQSTRELAADVARHLAHEPVQARAPGAAYRLGKFLRRHRRAVIAGAAGLILLTGGIVFAWQQAGRARQGEQQAQSALTQLAATAPVHAAHARDLAKLGDFPGADASLAAARQLRPDDPELLLLQGHLQEARAQFAAAAQHYRAVLQLAPAHPAAALHLDLCTALEAPRTPDWYRTLGRLAVQMLDEGRPPAERAAVCGILKDEAERRLSAVESLRGYSPWERLSIAPDGLLAASLSGLPLTDLSMLKDLPFTTIDVSYCPLPDMSPLPGMPVIAVNLAGTRITDFSGLRECRRLRSAALHDTTFADASVLRELPVFWLSLSRTRVADITPLRPLPLKVLRLDGSQVASLAPLAGLPVEELDIGGLPVTDFAPLADCASLVHLTLSGTRIADLAPLRALKLKTLILTETPVSDLSPLRQMPLLYLHLGKTRVTDLSPLRGISTLLHLTLSKGAENVAALRTMPQLERLSWSRRPDGNPSLTAAEFWAAWDQENSPP